MKIIKVTVKSDEKSKNIKPKLRCSGNVRFANNSIRKQMFSSQDVLNIFTAKNVLSKNFKTSNSSGQPSATFVAAAANTSSQNMKSSISLDNNNLQI